MRCLSVVLLPALLACAGVAHAAPIAVNNPGFEADLAAANTFPALIPQGWALYDPQTIFNGSNRAVGVLNPTGSTFFPGGAPEGSNVALTWLDDGEGAGNHHPLGLRQTLGVDLAANTRYTLSVEVGNIDSGIGSPPFDGFGFFNIKGFPGYAVQLLAGGVVIGEDNNALGNSIAEGTFATSTVQVVTGASVLPGQTLEIRLVNLNLPGTTAEPGIEVDFDNVRLDATALPSPATLWLFGGAWAGWMGLGRRKRA